MAATIIDALVVEFGLDPRKFSEGLRNVTDELNRHARSVDSSAKHIQAAATRGTTGFFSIFRRSVQQTTAQTGTATRNLGDFYQLLGQHFQQASTKLDTAAAQSRRSGQGLAAGAKSGAVGLRALTTAAVAAHTALNTVKHMISETGRVADETARTGRRALAAGAQGNVSGFSAYSLAAQATVGADPAQVQQEIVGLQQDVISLRERGIWSERFNELIRGGVALTPGDRSITFDKLMGQIAETLRGKSPEEAINWAQAYGFSPDLAQFLRLPNQQRQGAIAEATPRSVTPRQVEELTKLDNAITKVTQEYNALWRELTTRFSEQGLRPALDGFAALLRGVQENSAAMVGMQVLAGGVFALAMATATVAIGRLVQAVFGLAKNPGVGILARLLKFSAVGAAAGAVASGGLIPGAVDPDLSNAPSAPGNKTWKDRLDSWNPKNWRIFGGRKSAAEAGIPSGAGASAGGGTGQRSSDDPRGFTDPSIAAVGAVIAQKESRNRDVNNFMYNVPGSRRMGSDGVDVGYTAGGYYQMLDSNWVKYANELGIDTKKYPRAKGAPGAIQDRVFEAMFKKEGYKPWSSGAGGPMNSSSIGEAEAARSSALSKVSISMQAIRSTRWAERSVSNRASTYNNDTSIGQVNINTQATDANGIGGAIAGAIKRNNVVTEANAGLDY